jgi:Family of unknown function (DUF6011)
MSFITASSFKQFALAGNARFTIVSKKTGTRFTFRVRQPGPDRPWFVSLLTGSDNESDYTFFGTIFQNGSFRHSKKSSISSLAQSVVAFDWFWKHLQVDDFDFLPAQVEVHHEGRCGRCGRALTVPESIESGFGPECINHVH